MRSTIKQYTFNPVDLKCHDHHCVAVPWLGEGLSTPHLCPLQVVSLPYLPMSSLHRLAGLPCRLFLWYGQSPSGNTRGPLVAFEAVNVPCSGPLQFSHFADYVYDLRPIPEPDLDISIIACDVEHIVGPTSVAASWFYALLLKISRCLAYASQTAIILRCTRVSICRSYFP